MVRRRRTACRNRARRSFDVLDLLAEPMRRQLMHSNSPLCLNDVATRVGTSALSLPGSNRVPHPRAIVAANEEAVKHSDSCRQMSSALKVKRRGQARRRKLSAVLLEHPMRRLRCCHMGCFFAGVGAGEPSDQVRTGMKATVDSIALPSFPTMGEPSLFIPQLSAWPCGRKSMTWGTHGPPAASPR